MRFEKINNSALDFLGENCHFERFEEHPTCYLWTKTAASSSQLSSTSRLNGRNKWTKKDSINLLVKQNEIS